MPITLDGTNGITTPTYGGADTSEYLVPVTQFKNRIINGGMQVWQRGTSFNNTANSNQYTADRWNVFGGVGLPVATSQVSSGLQDYPLALRVQRPNGNTATTNTLAQQVIETANCRDLAGSTVTLSFWARAGSNYSPSGNVLNIYVRTGTGSDEGATNLINAVWTGLATTSTTVTLTTSMQYFTFTTSIPAGTNEVAIQFATFPTGTAGANDFFDVTKVQLEVGSTATSFDTRSFGSELQLCQRYYARIVDPTCRGVSTSGAAGGASRLSVMFPVTMRAYPTFTTSGTFNFWNGSTTRSGTNATGIFGSTSTNMLDFDMDINAAFPAASQAVCMYAIGSSPPSIMLSAEL